MQLYTKAVMCAQDKGVSSGYHSAPKEAISLYTNFKWTLSFWSRKTLVVFIDHAMCYHHGCHCQPELINLISSLPNNQGTCIYKKEMSSKLTEYIHTNVKFVNNIQVSNLLGA